MMTVAGLALAAIAAAVGILAWLNSRSPARAADVQGSRDEFVAGRRRLNRERAALGPGACAATRHLDDRLMPAGDGSLLFPPEWLLTTPIALQDVGPPSA